MEFRILGPLEVVEAGRNVALGGLKQRAVLALLLLNANAVVPRGRLVDELWGGEPPKTAEATLRVFVSQLRKALPHDEEIIQNRAPGYLVRLDPDTLDLTRFERLLAAGAQALERGEAETAARRLREGLALWRGEPLADFPYEPFAQAPAARLEAMRLGALELRIEADLRLARDVELVPELEGIRRAHPFRERFTGQLMLALYRSGRQADALRVYDETRRQLDAELGIEPSRTLQMLQRSILRQDITLNPVEPPAAAPAAAVVHGSILVVSDDGAGLDELVALAGSLGRAPPREVLLVGITAEGKSLARASADLAFRREALNADGLVARSAVFTSPSRGRDVIRLTVEQDAGLLLLHVPLSSFGPSSTSRELIAILRSAPCDIALVVSRGEPRSPDAEAPIFVPFGGLEHDWAAIELGAWLARSRGVELRMLGTAALRSTGQRDASRLLATASIIVQRVAGVAAEPVLVSPGLESLLDATAGGAFLIMGLSSRWQHEGIGGARTALARLAQPRPVLVRRGLRPGGLAPQQTHTRYTWSLAGAGQ